MNYLVAYCKALSIRSSTVAQQYWVYTRVGVIVPQSRSAVGQEYSRQYVLSCQVINYSK